MASNIGSTATIVGNPQNMLIGITSGISFARFFFYLFPVPLISTIALIAVVYFFYRKAFSQGFEGSSDMPREVRSYDSQAIKRLTPVLVLIQA